jgi:branched-chain amino acid transport system ATP-binding protein
MTEALLTCRGLTMRFGGIIALDSLDLDVAAGEIVGLVGPNGSGKTTFFNVLSGLYLATAGVVEFVGDSLFRKSPQTISRSGIARTFQHSRLALEQTVFDNIVVGNLRRLECGWFSNFVRRAKWQRELDAMTETARSLTRRFNPAIADRLFQPAGSFSMIDRRRIEICRALVGEPRLLLLDEPSAGMTDEEARRLMDDVLAFRSEITDLSIVLVEHEMQVIRRVSNRCVVLNFGRKIFEGSFDALVDNAEVQAAYLGRDT